MLKQMAKTTMPSALKFELTARCSTTRARASILQLPHGTVQTPLFMPVATQGSLKGLTPEQLEATGCRLCLNNTYHLGLRPGQEVLDTIKGAHALQSWPHNILTDSGGFQMVSLLDLATVTERGVEFLSPHDGTPMLLTPEHSIALQHSIGSDIIMQLDDVIATTSADTERMREAMLRSVRWLDRCIEEHSKPDPMAAVEGQTYASRQNLFCIIQGGLDLEMRRECCEEMVKRGTPGIAIGGLSGGEEKESYCKVVKACTEMLPEGKPRYVMGVGYPEDLIVSVALGADMFDCVWGTRTAIRHPQKARFGNAITSSGVLNLRSSTYATDFTPIDPHCQCPVCRPLDSPAPPLLNSSICPPSYASEGETYTAKGMGITKAYIHHLVAKETVGAHLLTMHNVAWLLALMARAREAVVGDRFPAFVKEFFEEWYQGDRGRYPGWAVEALRGVGVDLLE
ncbi:queuine tRNA-ribosyltransferase [Morchella conica CCBAS932]|uniref:Queuine tRNA-ribosyltransferase catalytic subunit 1 n=1 Tax=Morchella conica CCBAS932 TaxID=1392247 RepID=A0A3N4KI69_9PEZI|nr:queuine tRNA-ribosyltransferase [Morchella conica CCBAS932]